MNYEPSKFSVFTNFYGNCLHVWISFAEAIEDTKLHFFGNSERYTYLNKFSLCAKEYFFNIQKIKISLFCKFDPRFKCQKIWKNMCIFCGLSPFDLDFLISWHSETAIKVERQKSRRTPIQVDGTRAPLCRSVNHTATTLYYLDEV